MTAIARRTCTLFVVLCLAACSFVASYDETIDQQITAAVAKVDAWASDIRVAKPASATYAASAKFYQELGLSLDAIEFRTQRYDKNDNTLTQIVLIRRSVERVRAVHESTGIILADEAEAFKRQMHDQFGLLLGWELAKKNRVGGL
ncbi:hypothetical protein [Roseiterribacter gracilis]|uniref:Uncharacterized protein n=1 Tax=Roseiterribacter gracilis TaxID=2812848 RepID=A0A8S8X8K6_9PROT|nr:hypothetical protein TMPK1_04080 [Rhodospirillales bacterium TMPK1]